MEGSTAELVIEETYQESTLIENSLEDTDQIDTTEQLLPLETDIFARRSLEQQITPEVSRKILAYDTDVDAVHVFHMRAEQMVHPEKAHIIEQQKRNEIIFNQEVYAMERWHAPIGRERNHRMAYNEETGEIDMYADGTDITMLNLIENGIRHRAGKGTEEDSRREHAEWRGMEKAVALFRDKATRPGTKVFSFSPPGGSYRHDFFDGFELREDEQGNRSVLMQRFATSLLPEDYQGLIPKLTDGFIRYDHTPTAVELLGNPVVLPFGKFETLEGVRNYLHREKEIDFTEGRIINHVLRDEDVKRAMQRYVNVLFAYPTDPEKYQGAFRSMINRVDALVYHAKYGEYQDREVEEILQMPFFAGAEAFAGRSSMVIASDCGDGFGAESANGPMSPNAMTSANGSPFGVADFAFGGRESTAKKKWDYTKSGVCQGPCGKSFREGGLGPCSICRDCEDKVPMLSGSQLANRKKEKQTARSESGETPKKQKKEKKLFLLPSDELLASIKKEIPSSDTTEEKIISIPEESEEKSWTIDIFRSQKQLSQAQQKKQRDKMTMHAYAMNNKEEKPVAEMVS